MDNEILASPVGPDGSIWFGSYNQGVSRYDGQRWSTFQTRDKLPTNVLGFLVISRTGIIWLSTNDGISSYDGQSLITYSQIGSLKNNIVWFIYIDREDSKWFGTSDGVARYDVKVWTSYSSTQYPWLDIHVNCMTADLKGGYWFGSDAGAALFDGKDWIKENYLGDIAISAISIQADGTLWFGSRRKGV